MKREINHNLIRKVFIIVIVIAFFLSIIIISKLSNLFLNDANLMGAYSYNTKINSFNQSSFLAPLSSFISYTSNKTKDITSKIINGFNNPKTPVIINKPSNNLVSLSNVFSTYGSALSSYSLVIIPFTFSSSESNNFSNNNFINDGILIFINTSKSNYFINNLLRTNRTWISALKNTSLLMEQTIFDKEFGQIKILPKFEINSSLNLTLSDLNISLNKTFLNSSKYPFLNKSAFILLRNISFKYVKAVVDYSDNNTFVNCPDTLCSNLNKNNSIVTYNVSHFTSFAVKDVGLFKSPLDSFTLNNFQFILEDNNTAISNNSLHNNDTFIIIKSPSFGKRVKLFAKFTQDKIDLRNMVIRADEHRTFVSLDNTIGINSTHTLIVPYYPNISLYVCPIAKSFTEVNNSCNQLILFTPYEILTNASKNGVYLRKINNEIYINNLTNTGAGSNQIPNATNISLVTNDSLNYTNSSLLASWTFVDSDGGNEQANETLWYNSSDNINYFYQQQLDNYTTIISSNTSKNQYWIFSVRVFDGLDWSNFSNSSVLFIKNFKPVPKNISLLHILPDTLQASWDFFDLDNDLQSNYFSKWYNKTSGSFSEVLSYQNLTEISVNNNETWIFSIALNDGQDWGSFVNSSEFKVPIITSQKDANITVNISSVASILLNQDFIDFKAGYVYPNSSYAIIDSGINSDGEVFNGSWPKIIDGINSEFIIKNDGNIDVNLSLSSGKDASSFFELSSSNAKYQYRVTPSDTSNGCLTILYQNGTAANPFGGLNETWTDLTGSNQLVCHNFTYGSSNLIEVDLRLFIPKETPPGVKTDIITFTATALNGDERI